MKFSRELSRGLYTIHACQDDKVIINAPPGEEGVDENDRLTLQQNFIITPQRLLKMWPPTAIDTIEEKHLSAIADLGLEVLLLGTGKQLRFPSGEQLAALVSLGIGYEVMDTPAACRTYNILAGEGRRVGAAIILES